MPPKKLTGNLVDVEHHINNTQDLITHRKHLRAKQNALIELHEESQASDNPQLTIILEQKLRVIEIQLDKNDHLLKEEMEIVIKNIL